MAANIDHATTTAGLMVDINLVTNDIPNTVVLVTIGTVSSHGFVTDLGGGSVRYTSTDATYAGLDCFDYTASVGGCSLSGVLKISVLSSTSTTLTATYIGTRDNSAGNGQTFGLGGIISIVVSPDCNYVYAAGQSESSIGMFSRHPTTGSLSFVEKYTDNVGEIDGLYFVNSLAISIDGKHLYAASRLDNAVAVFSRNISTGKLTFVERLKDGEGSVDGLGGAAAVTVSPDGKHVYALGTYEDAMAIFSRDASTGRLTFQNIIQDVSGIKGANAVAVSTDGRHVYVSGNSYGNLVVFSRNLASGNLTELQTLRENVDGVKGLRKARSATVSFDGKNVYVVSERNNSISSFVRNTSTGLLTFQAVLKNGVGGVLGMSDPWAVAVTSTGEYVYVAGGKTNALVTFKRNTSTGALTFVKAIADGGIEGADGMRLCRSVGVSLDCRSIYVGGLLDDAIAIFSELPGAP